MNCIRFLFCFYNFLFLLIGGAVLGLGIWLSLDPQVDGALKDFLSKVGERDTETTNNIIDTLRHASFVLIAFGAFIFLLSFLGYCGAIKESRFLLGFYTFLLVLILVLEIVAVVLIFVVYGPQIEERTKSVLKTKLVTNYGMDRNATVLVDDFMRKVECCGIYNGTDFKDLTNGYLSVLNYTVPESCCKDQEKPGCSKSPTDDNSWINTGCFDKIKADVMTESAKFSAAAAGIVIVLLQLIGIVFSCWIYKEAKYTFA